MFPFVIVVEIQTERVENEAIGVVAGVLKNSNLMILCLVCVVCWFGVTGYGEVADSSGRFLCLF